MVTGPSQTIDATAADIMILWSPLWTIAPPLSLGFPWIMQPSSVATASPPMALIMLTTVSILLLSLNFSWGAPYRRLSITARTLR